MILNYSGVDLAVYTAAGEEMEAECAKELVQIKTLHYAEVLDDFEPTKIYKYAVACYKKQGCGGTRVVYMRHSAPSPPVKSTTVMFYNILLWTFPFIYQSLFGGGIIFDALTTATNPFTPV
jgi:hypothetical protein